VDEAIDIVFGNSVGDALGAVNVDINVREVPGAPSVYPFHPTVSSFILTW